jgi:hypothetical protein
MLKAIGADTGVEPGLYQSKKGKSAARVPRSGGVSTEGHGGGAPVEGEGLCKYQGTVMLEDRFGFSYLFLSSVPCGLWPHLFLFFPNFPNNSANAAENKYRSAGVLLYSFFYG